MSIELPRTPGRVGPHRESHEPRLIATKFLKKPESVKPDAYADWDGTHGLTHWGMDHNDVWGCCGAAGVDHGNMAKANDMKLYGTLGQPKFPGMLQTYWAYGLSVGEKGTPPDQPDQPDDGVDNARWLRFLCLNGVIDGYGEVPLDYLDAFAPLGHGLLIGQNLYEDAQNAFSNRTAWGAEPEKPNPDDGHDTWLIKLGSDGGGAVITWGQVQPFTLFYRKHNITDAWIIWDRRDPHLDWPKLQLALDEVHGKEAATHG